jgi:CheY-like chemotaxis protein
LPVGDGALVEAVSGDDGLAGGARARAPRQRHSHPLLRAARGHRGGLLGQAAQLTPGHRRRHRVQVAPSGLAGVEAARQEAPDVVLLDIGRPGMSGYEVARRLRGEGGQRKAFLIAGTGYGADSDRLACAAAGIDLYLAKPVEPEVVRGVVKRFQRAAGR